MNVFIVIAFNESGFYPVSVSSNLEIAKNYALYEYKERGGVWNIRIYKKLMDAPHTIKDEIVFTKEKIK